MIERICVLADETLKRAESLRVASENCRLSYSNWSQVVLSGDGKLEVEARKQHFRLYDEMMDLAMDLILRQKRFEELQRSLDAC